eukprot:7743997-Pyramimonas_sp.AAC.1
MEYAATLKPPERKRMQGAPGFGVEPSGRSYRSRCDRPSGSKFWPRIVMPRRHAATNMTLRRMAE